MFSNDDNALLPLIHNGHKVFNQLSIFSIQWQRQEVFRLILTSLYQLPIFVEQGLRANPILHTFPKRSSSQDIIRMLTVKALLVGQYKRDCQMLTLTNLNTSHASEAR